MVRSIFLYSVVAPEPAVAEGVIPFPQSRFYHAESGRLAEYETPLQTVTAAAWLILLLAAGASLVISRSSVDFRLLLALLLCIAFVPFLTRILAGFVRGDDGQAAALLYGITLTTARSPPST